MRFNVKVNPWYALFYFMSEDGRRQIKECAVSTTGLHTLSTGKVSKLKLPLPPLGEQSQFAAYVAKVEKMEAVAREIVTTADMLYRAKLQECFGSGAGHAIGSEKRFVYGFVHPCSRGYSLFVRSFFRDCVAFANGNVI